MDAAGGSFLDFGDRKENRRIFRRSAQNAATATCRAPRSKLGLDQMSGIELVPARGLEPVLILPK